MKNLTILSPVTTTLESAETNGQSKHKLMHTGTASVKYTCSMHPDVISDQPGKCPKCGMTLEKMEG